MVLAQAVKTLSDMSARIRYVEHSGEKSHVIEAELHLQEKAQGMSAILADIEAHGLCVHEAVLENDNRLLFFKVRSEEEAS